MSATARTLTSFLFVEGYLRAILETRKIAPTLAADVLTMMDVLPFDKHALPLKLAFRFAVDGDGTRIGELAPELRRATQIMFDRLTK